MKYFYFFFVVLFLFCSCKKSATEPVIPPADVTYTFIPSVWNTNIKYYGAGYLKSDTTVKTYARTVTYSGEMAGWFSTKNVDTLIVVYNVNLTHGSIISYLQKDNNGQPWVALQSSVSGGVVSFTVPPSYYNGSNGARIKFVIEATIPASQSYHFGIKDITVFAD